MQPEFKGSGVTVRPVLAACASCVWKDLHSNKASKTVIVHPWCRYVYSEFSLVYSGVSTLGIFKCVQRHPVHRDPS